MHYEKGDRMKKFVSNVVLGAALSFGTLNTSASDQDVQVSVARAGKPMVLMQAAYNTAKADGHKDPGLVQAVLLQESMAGTMKNHRVVTPNKKQAYFGAMQIKLVAAKEVLGRWPEMYETHSFDTRTDDEIKARLIVDDKFNIAVASKYLIILRDTYGYTGAMLLNAYNRGPFGAKRVDPSFHYGVSAQKKLEAWKRGKIKINVQS